MTTLDHRIGVHIRRLLALRPGESQLHSVRRSLAERGTPGARVRLLPMVSGGSYGIDNPATPGRDVLASAQPAGRSPGIDGISVLQVHLRWVGKRSAICVSAPHRIPTSTRLPPMAPTKTPRTKRHYPAQDGTAANMALLAMERLYAGRTG